MDRLEIVCDEALDPLEALAWLREHARVGEPVVRRRRELWLDTPTAELAAAGVVAAVVSHGEERELVLQPVPVDEEVLDACARNRVTLDGQEPAVVIRHECARLGLPLAHTPVADIALDVSAEVRLVEADTYAFELGRELVRATRGDREATMEGLRIRLVEGDRAGLVELVASMLAALDARPGSLLERVRRAMGLPGMRWGGRPPPFDPAEPIDRVGRMACRTHWQTVRAHEAGARIGLDTEHVHKLRVAIRRLRAALRVFDRVFDEGEAARLVDELGVLGRIAGRVRDLDVQALSLPARAARLGGTATGWSFTAAAVESLRDAARTELRATLAGPSFAALSARVEHACALGNAPAGRPVASVVADIVDGRVHRFARARKAFDDEPTAERAHRLRIAGKNLRYALELLRPALPELDDDVIDGLATFQDRLGRLQDDLQLGTLASELAGAAPSDAAMAWTVGALAGTGATARAWVRPIVETALAELDPERTISTIERALRAADD